MTKGVSFSCQDLPKFTKGVSIPSAFRVIVHCEYMVLAKKTSVLREAVLLFVEPRRFGKQMTVKMCPAKYADIFLGHVKTAVFRQSKLQSMQTSF